MNYKELYNELRSARVKRPEAPMEGSGMTRGQVLSFYRDMAKRKAEKCPEERVNDSVLKVMKILGVVKIPRPRFTLKNLIR